jgi:hypothetical protein
LIDLRTPKEGLGGYGGSEVLLTGRQRIELKSNKELNRRRHERGHKNLPFVHQQPLGLA